MSIYNIDAERGFIGCLLVWPERTVHKAKTLIEAHELYDSFNSWTYKTILKLADSGLPIDVKTVGVEMKNDRRWNGAESALKIHKFTDCTATAESLEYFVDRIKQAATRRALSVASQQIGQIATSNADLDDVVDRANATMRDITTYEQQKGGVVYVDDQAKAVYRDAINKEQPKDVIRSGMAVLDDIIYGFWPELNIVAGRTSMGKSTFGLNIATNAALRGETVTYITLEDTPETCMTRIMSRLSDVPISNIIHKKLTGEQCKKLDGASELMTALKIRFIGHGMSDTEKVIAAAESHSDASMMIIDHLGHMSDSKSKGMYESTSQSCRKIAQFTARMKKPVILLHQLNREASKGGDSGNIRTPQLTDLRQTGEVEQLARKVLLLHRPHYYNEAKDPNEMAVIIAKNSNGPTCKIQLYCKMECMYVGNGTLAEGY